MSQSPWHDGDDTGGGDSAPPPARPAVRGPRRPAGPLVPTLLILVVLAILVSILAGFWTDLLWYRSVDYASVFTTRLGTQILLFFIGLALAGGLVWGSLYTAYRTRPFYIPSTPAQQSLEQYRSAIEPIRRIALILIPLFLGGLAALTMAGNWKAYLLWRNAVPFGVKDPQFGKDVGYYVFTLPWIQLLIGFLTMVLIMALLAGVFVHYVYGGLQLPNRGPTTRAAFVHLGVLGAALFLVRGAADWFGRYSQSSAEGGIVTGITYTAAHAVLPTKAILAVASAICAVLFLSAIWTRTWRLPLVAVGLLTVLSIVVGGIYPGVIQSLRVKPSEKNLESKYIQRNIDATRAAYGLTDVQAKVYSATTDVAQGQLHQDAETIPGIRIMDPNVISTSFRQSQAPRSFYTFPDPLDVDRYTIGGKSQDAVVAARELNLGGVPTSQRNWVNDHTVYTHGYGFVAAYGNQRTSKGDPVFFQQGFTTVGPDGRDYEPRIYFGEASEQYSIVGGPAGGTKREFDYPAGSSGQINNTYSGSGGVPMGSFLRKLAYAVDYREPKMLLSDTVTPQSRMLDHRTPDERVERVAPWLTVDGNVYPAVVDGRVVWIVDGYTTSANYPNSDKVNLADATSDSVTSNSAAVTVPVGGQINYIRNSVKATVDAFDGSVNLYAWDTTDPILKAWQKAFGNTVKPISDISSELMAHLRYPQDLLKVQRGELTRYHVTDAASWYGGGDFWAIPNDPTHASQSESQPTYFQSLALPGQTAPAFSLTSTFVPTGGTREILRGFLAADGDAGSTAGERAPGYGVLRLLELPSAPVVNGPGQVENQIENSTAASSSQTENLNLSQFIAQSRQSGKELTFGNLLTLPVGGGLLYVQPLFVQQSKEAGSFPQNVATVAVFGNTVGWGDTLGQALDGVFGGNSGVTGSGTTTPPTTTPPSTKPPTTTPPTTGTNAALAAAIQKIQTAYDKGQAALKAGDFAAYGEAQKELQAAIADAEQAVPPGAGGTPTPTATPTGTATG
ncbi:MAG: UPF0182 family protein [Nostocoides sp.]